MNCAYCGQEAKGTKEHIISCGILDLFPECNITYDTKRNVAHEGDPTVKDVCSTCNKKLSYIDSYAIDMVKEYGLTDFNRDDKIIFKYDYVKLQKALLKFAYNDMRSYKYDCTYFDNELIEYMINEDLNTPKKHISIFAGLAVNTSPLPAAFLGNRKLQWNKDPVFLSNSMIKFIDYETGEIFIDDQPQMENFDGLVFSYIFRFNSIQFILLCWDKNSANNETNSKVFSLQYPYTLLDNKGESELSLCTNEFNYHQIMLVNVNWDQITEVERMRILSNGGTYPFKENFDKFWKQEEQKIATENPRERQRRKRGQD